MGLDIENHQLEAELTSEVLDNNAQCQTVVDEVKDIASGLPSDNLLVSNEHGETLSESGESGTDFDDSSDIDPNDPKTTNLHVSLPWMSNGQDIIYSFFMPKKHVSLKQLCQHLEIEYRKGICCSKAITGTCKIDDREINIHYSITTGDDCEPQL